MSNPNSLSIIIIEKNAKLRTLTVKDYKEEELAAPKPQELRPSLLIKKIIKI